MGTKLAREIVLSDEQLAKVPASVLAQAKEVQPENDNQSSTPYDTLINTIRELKSEGARGRSTIINARIGIEEQMKLRSRAWPTSSYLMSLIGTWLQWESEQE